MSWNGIPGAGPVQPELTFQRAGDQLILSWTEPGFVLQENNDLTNSTGWKDVAGAVNSPVSVVIETVGNKFFRLRK